MEQQTWACDSSTSRSFDRTRATLERRSGEGGIRTRDGV
jgi:hypothetical protein